MYPIFNKILINLIKMLLLHRVSNFRFSINMAQYLDPKNDLTFKRVFSERKHLCMSLINSMLPLKKPVVSIEYYSGELVPVLTKAYVMQLDKAEDFELLQPVYALNFVNDKFEKSPDMENGFVKNLMYEKDCF